jgi:hypothetical protein
MNLYLFISPNDNELTNNQIWANGNYFAAVWESSEKLAQVFAKDFYPSYNPGWLIREVTNPEKLSAVEDDDRWNNEWDY